MKKRKKTLEHHENIESFCILCYHEEMRDTLINAVREMTLCFKRIIIIIIIK